MYHRGYSNQTVGYNNKHRNMKRINRHKLQYGNVSLSPHSYTNNISVSPRSCSPTLSYELPYQPELPLSNGVSTKKKTPKTPKQMKFMSKITEESKPNTIITTPPPPAPRSSPPSPSPTPKPAKKGVKDKTHRRNCVNHKNSKSKHKTRHHSDDIDTNTNDTNDTNNDTNTNKDTPKMTNSTSNRSYRKYKTRATKQKTHKKSKKHKHYTSESHELLNQQNKHRNTQKKTSNKRERKKNRAQSTVLASKENNNNMEINTQNERPETAKYDIEYEYEYEYNYYESKQSSQDSYVANIKSKQMDNRPQTARPLRKSKHNKIRSNGTIITKSKKLDNTHHKSHSHNKVYEKHTNNHNYNHGHGDKTYEKRHQTNDKRRGKKMMKSKEKKLNFNEGAMDYMSAEQQLLYLYDYTSAHVTNRSSASTHTTSHTDTLSTTNTRTPKTYTSERDGYYTEGISSVSNRRNGNNSDAITPQSELTHTICSSPITVSYPIERGVDNSHNIRNSHSLQFLTSPPLSTITYSQLSTRAVTYSPAAHKHNQHRDDSHSYSHSNYLQVNRLHREPYIENETQLPRLPSPHYLFKLDSNSENDFPITPFNKDDIEYTGNTATNPTIIIHDEDSAQSGPVIVDHNQIDQTHLLEIPASLTAEENGNACYIEGENMNMSLNISDISTMENTTITHDNLEGMDCDDTDIDSVEFPTTPPIYRLCINDQEWQDVVSNSNPKTPSHRLRQQLIRNSKLQCTV